MRIFAANSPHDALLRAAAPAEILRRLAFGRPQSSPIRTSTPATPVLSPSAEVPANADEGFDLAQRVRLSGEW